MPRKTHNLINRRFGSFVVMSRGEDIVNKNGSHSTAWVCQCDCGNIKTVVATSLLSGATKSCGCLALQTRTTHGKSKTRLYNTWTNIKQRCYNPNNNHYKNYGGRGIKMCDEWRYDYDTFEYWAYQNGYNDSLTIDRICNDGDYTPENCRWVTKVIQDNNKRTNVVIEYNGESHTIMEWSRILDIPYSTLQSRHKLGWSTKQIIETPKHKHRLKENE